MDEEKVVSILPGHFVLLRSIHLPNLGLVSLASVFKHLPFKLWLCLNDILGLLRKGYGSYSYFRDRPRVSSACWEVYLG